MAKQSEQVQEIPIAELFPFKDHPFRVLDDEAMQRTVESMTNWNWIPSETARQHCFSSCPIQTPPSIS